MSDIMEHYQDDGLHEECGVFGMYDFDGHDVARTIYYGTGDRKAVALRYLTLKDQRARSCLPRVWDL